MAQVSIAWAVRQRALRHVDDVCEGALMVDSPSIVYPESHMRGLLAQLLTFTSKLTSLDTSTLWESVLRDAAIDNFCLFENHLYTCKRNFLQVCSEPYTASRRPTVVRMARRHRSCTNTNWAI